MVRAAVMNRLAPRLQGCHWLDLCSGSGVMACEAIERGASRVVAIEHHRGTAAICRVNLDSTASGVEPTPKVQVVSADLVRWLSRGRPSDDPGFDLVYFDPPYAAKLYGPGLEALRCGAWLRPGALVICEHASRKPPSLDGCWDLIDQRRYGSCGVLVLSLPEHCPGGTDSRPPQTGRAG
jgi:16S rRNA (guanine966-N2)-methyltransferase